MKLLALRCASQKLGSSHGAAVHNCLARAHLPAHAFHLQGGSEKLGDEDLELVLDKLVRLLAYISGGWGVPGFLCMRPAGSSGRWLKRGVPGLARLAQHGKPAAQAEAVAHL